MNIPELFGEKIVIEKTCHYCGKKVQIEVFKTQYDAWRKGMYAQHAFFNLTPEEREMIISGTHPECWNRIFGTSEEAD